MKSEEWGWYQGGKDQNSGGECLVAGKDPQSPDLLWKNLLTEDRMVAPFLMNLSVSPVWLQLLTTGFWATTLLGLAGTQTLTLQPEARRTRTGLQAFPQGRSSNCPRWEE